jgi:hypothetical protein
MARFLSAKGVCANAALQTIDAGISPLRVHPRSNDYAFLGVFGQLRLKIKLTRVRNTIKNIISSSNPKFTRLVAGEISGVSLDGRIVSMKPFT